MPEQEGAWPEIVFGSSDLTEAKQIERAVRNQQLRKITAKVYTSNFDDAPENIVMNHWLVILSHLFPGAVVSHKSALDGRPKNGEIILTYTSSRTVNLPGLTVRLLKGPKALQSDMPFSRLFLSSVERAFLENLQPARASKEGKKTVEFQEIESRLDKLAQSRGDQYLNELRDHAKKIAPALGFEQEFDKLKTIISSLLGSHDIGSLQTEAGRSRALQQPYDTHRFQLFLNLASFLREGLYEPVLADYKSDQSYRILSFWEAYFSNYIEGTTFQVEEAKEVIFDGKLLQNRPADSHDIQGTYEIVSDLKEMRTLSANYDDFFELLRKRHALVMAGRPEKNPGCFKEKLNRAGSTVFVAPELVKGTLIQGFDILQSLPKGFARACFMMFLASEVHPFSDGNGRLARIMMNAELVASNEFKIMIPTVYRVDYLGALKKLSNTGEPKPYVDMLYRAQRFSASVEYSDFSKSNEQLQSYNSFAEGEGEVLSFN